MIYEKALGDETYYSQIKIAKIRRKKNTYIYHAFREFTELYCFLTAS